MSGADRRHGGGKLPGDRRSGPNGHLVQVAGVSAQTDIAVIGAGPAGANAALAAARRGFSVTLLDEQPKPGGQVWRAKSAAILDAPATPETLAGDRLRHE